MLEIEEEYLGTIQSIVHEDLSLYLAAIILANIIVPKQGLKMWDLC